MARPAKAASARSAESFTETAAMNIAPERTPSVIARLEGPNRHPRYGGERQTDQSERCGRHIRSDRGGVAEVRRRYGEQQSRNDSRDASGDRARESIGCEATQHGDDDERQAHVVEFRSEDERSGAKHEVEAGRLGGEDVLCEGLALL
jgi:hypothetical protein